MFRRRFRLPSPALVISMVTLSLVLGGTAFAANTTILSKHKDAKADTKLVKKLAPSLSVKHAKSANSATTATSATHATSADSATNATNATNATHATTATNATHASTADSAVSVTGYNAPKAVKVSATSTPGTTVTLFENAAFKVTATCLDNGGGSFTASAYITMKQAHSVLVQVGADVTSTDIGPADGPKEVTYYEASGTTSDFESWSYYNEYNAIAPDGTSIQGFVGPGVHVLGADCVFQHYEIGS